MLRYLCLSFATGQGCNLYALVVRLNLSLGTVYIFSQFFSNPFQTGLVELAAFDIIHGEGLAMLEVVLKFIPGWTLIIACPWPVYF